jgi:hypothetical protein
MFMKKVLIGCEYSGRVRDAFTKKGHYAMSCDILPTESPGNHYQGNIMDIINDGWDLLIAFPPCTYIAKCGLHYLHTQPDRKEKLNSAFGFVLSLYNSSIDKVAIENPEGWLNTNWQKPTQIIQPYYFGEPEIKTTCLWLKNLPPLTYSLQDNLFEVKTATDRPQPKKTIYRKTGPKAGQPYNYYFRQGKSAKDRAKTFEGIANAMADQWG